MRKLSSKQGRHCALAILLCAAWFPPDLTAQRALKITPKVMEVLNMPPMEVKNDDPPLLRLKKERFNAALNEAKGRFDLYKRA
jgi:hypothetical protein